MLYIFSGPSYLSLIYEDDNQTVGTSIPDNISGTSGSFIFIGPLDEKPIDKKPTLYKLFGESNKCYWMAEHNIAIRPYLESKLFGRWNYPLGVTLYGLTQTARILQRPDILSYIEKHIEICVNLYEYSVWDKMKYGFPEINIQISTISSLDDCGSFGSAMLEFYQKPTANVQSLANIIGNYILTGQSRLDDEVLYRKDGIYGTLWVDDMYMSIPFLCRYYKLTGDERYINDAINQVFLFKKYLFIPETGIMSHVYSLKHKTSTKVPWGRGNGWCLFSISELLEYLPTDHNKRPELLELFDQLCRSYLFLQGDEGLWHQVLTHTESYVEASTA